MKISDGLRGQIRAAISNAYYEARNHGQTMEVAADNATAKVVALIAPLERTERPLGDS